MTFRFFVNICFQARRREFSRKRANNVVQNKGDIAALGVISL